VATRKPPGASLDNLICREMITVRRFHPMTKRSCFAAISAVLLLIVTSVTFGQRPRVVPDDPNQSSTTTPPPAQESVKAKYEGGVFG
jgi:hypothetical protein